MRLLDWQNPKRKSGAKSFGGNFVLAPLSISLLRISIDQRSVQTEDVNSFLLELLLLINDGFYLVCRFRRDNDIIKPAYWRELSNKTQ